LGGVRAVVAWAVGRISATVRSGLRTRSGGFEAGRGRDCRRPPLTRRTPGSGRARARCSGPDRKPASGTRCRRRSTARRAWSAPDRNRAARPGYRCSSYRWQLPRWCWCGGRRRTAAPAANPTPGPPSWNESRLAARWRSNHEKGTRARGKWLSTDRSPRPQRAGRRGHPGARSQASRKSLQLR
jgi:hypothetical protein